LGIRKSVAQMGVVLFLASMIIPPTGLAGLLLLLLASVLPEKEGELFGSMWPLSGYDNAIDGIYTRGQWLVRIRELDDEDAEESRRVSLGSLGITIGALKIWRARRGLNSRPPASRRSRLTVSGASS
jgi:hypothetical protein